jgi:hypothetical protein
LRGPNVRPPAEPVGRPIRGRAFSIPVLQIFLDEGMQIRYHQAEINSRLENPEAFPGELPGFIKIEVSQ